MKTITIKFRIFVIACIISSTPYAYSIRHIFVKPQHKNTVQQQVSRIIPSKMNSLMRFVSVPSKIRTSLSHSRQATCTIIKNYGNRIASIARSSILTAKKSVKALAQSSTQYINTHQKAIAATAAVIALSGTYYCLHTQLAQMFLHIGVKTERLSMVRLALILNPHLNLFMEHHIYSNLLIRAIEQDNVQMVRALVAHDVRYDDFIINRAIEQGNLNIVACLLTYNIGPMRPYWLASAARSGHSDVVRYLVEHGINLNERYLEGPALYYAIINQNIPIIHYLIEHGALLEVGGFNALRTAVQRGNLPIVTYLIEHGATVTNQHTIALRYNQHDIARYLERIHYEQEVLAARERAARIEAERRRQEEAIRKRLEEERRQQELEQREAERKRKEKEAIQRMREQEQRREHERRQQELERQARERAQREKQRQELLNQLRQDGISMCAICDASIDDTEFVRLPCHHAYCKNCLTQLLDLALKNKSTAGLKCPQPSCRHLFDVAEIQAIAGQTHPEKIKSFLDVKMEEWLSAQPGVRHCRTPNCPFTYLNETNSRASMQCPHCHIRFCANCTLHHATSQSCEQVEAEVARASDSSYAERATAEWKRAHTKQCPRCNTHIERSEGCNHMTCKKCSYEFCWLCSIRWPGYNQHACPTHGNI